MLRDTTSKEYERFKAGKMTPDEREEYLERINSRPEVPTVEFEITSTPIVAKVRKLDTKWSGSFDEDEENTAEHPPLNPEKYHCTLGVKYDDEAQATGYTDIEVLPFLKGKKWDEIAVGYVHGVRPDTIRVTTGMCKANAHPWRVTVIVDDENTILKITQEVEVALPSGVAHGEALGDALHYGIDSPQAKWHLLGGMTMMVSDSIIPGGAYYKTTRDGKVTDYPVPEADQPCIGIEVDVEDEVTKMIIDQLDSERP